MPHSHTTHPTSHQKPHHPKHHKGNRKFPKKLRTAILFGAVIVLLIIAILVRNDVVSLGKFFVRDNKTIQTTSTISDEILKKSNKVQTLTTKLLQTAKQLNLIKEKISTPSSSVKGEQTDKETLQGVEKLTQVAIERKQAMLDLLKDSPKVFLENTIPKNVRDQLPDEIQPLIESETKVKGKVAIVHFDDFSNKKSETKFVLDESTADKPSGKQYQLHFDKDLGSITSGSVILAKGFLLDRNLAISSADKTSIQIISTPTVWFQQGNRKMAVLLVNFLSDTSQPLTKDKIHSLVFADPQSVKNYYLENSFGKFRLSGDVFGWYTLDYTPSGCSGIFSDLTARAWNAATSAGVALGNYDFIAIVTPFISSCYAGGMGVLGFYGDVTYSWVNLYSWVPDGVIKHTFAHEIGHNLALHHANALDCGTTSIKEYLNGCRIYEYEDVTDVLGFVPYDEMLHFNGAHKVQASWLAPDKIQTVTANGLYTLGRLEDNSFTGPQILKIKKKDANYIWDNYYISYRFPIGFDNKVESATGQVRGAAVHIGSDFTYAPQTLRADTSPGSNYTNANLSEGRTFIDDVNGISITQKSHDDNSVTLDVLFGPGRCVKINPTTTITPSSQSAAAGQTVQYAVEITNNGSTLCGASTYRLTANVFNSYNEQYGWVIRTNPETITLTPGQSGRVTVSVTSPAGALIGAYRVALNTQNTSDNNSFAYNTVGYIIFTPQVIIESFNPTSGGRNTEVTITGDEFEEKAGAVSFGEPNLYYDSPAIKSWSNKKIIAIAAEVYKTGKVYVKTFSGKLAVSNEDFVYLKESIEETLKFSPSSGPVGSEVTLTGAYFASRQAEDKIFFGSTEAEVVSWSIYEVKVKVPSQASRSKIIFKNRLNNVFRSNTDFIVTNTAVKISGAVAIANVEPKGVNRFTTLSCPGKDFRLDSTMKISHPTLGNARWDCEPSFYFGDNKDAKVNTVDGEHNFTLTPPTGYKCSWYAVYGDRTSEKYNSCVVTVNIPTNANGLFVWFFVEKIPSQEAVKKPSISGFNPQSGPIGTSAVISGANFGSNKGSVSFNGVSSDIAGWTEASISAQVPKDATTGKIRVQTASSEIAETATNFIVELPPLSYKVTGAIAIAGTDSLNKNRFTALALCPGKEFKTDVNMKVTEPQLGDAKWDCEDPAYYFGDSKDAVVSLSPGYHTFTITPPNNYKCSWYAVYGDRDSENFKDCSVTVYLTKDSSALFIWFFVEPTSSTLGLSKEVRQSRNIFSEIRKILGF